MENCTHYTYLAERSNSQEERERKKEKRKEERKKFKSFIFHKLLYSTENKLPSLRQILIVRRRHFFYLASTIIKCCTFTKLWQWPAMIRLSNLWSHKQARRRNKKTFQLSLKYFLFGFFFGGGGGGSANQKIETMHHRAEIRKKTISINYLVINTGKKTF